MIIGIEQVIQFGPKEREQVTKKYIGENFPNLLARATIDVSFSSNTPAPPTC